MRTPEGKEKDKIKEYLESIGAWYCLPFMAGYGRRGAPDILACINGRFWGIEVKRPGKKLTPLQEARMVDIRLSGGYVAWGTADMVITVLEAGPQ